VSEVLFGADLTDGVTVQYNDDFKDNLMFQIVGQGILGHEEARALYRWLEEYLHVWKVL
jgi:hypothetical protein